MGPGKWEARLHALSIEAKSLEQALQAVRAEMAHAQCCIGRVHNSRIPLCRLPDRILADIFRMGARACDSQTDEYEFLESVTATCHHFREVALCASFLWSNVLFTPGTYLPRMRAYLERSREAPLQLTLVVNNVMRHWGVARVRSWIASLLPYLARCQSLTLRTSDHNLAQLILPFRNETMPYLRKFSWVGVDVDHTGSQAITWDSTAILEGEPISLSSCHITIRGASFPLRWNDQLIANLQHLTLVDAAGFPTRDVVELVARCQALKSMSWLHEPRDDDDDSEDSSETPVFSSSSLEMLQMDLLDRGGSDPTVLWRMDLPRLKLLAIAAWSSHIPPTTHAPSNVERFPALRSAWLSSRVFSLPTIMDFLSAHPRIEEFGCGINEWICGLISSFSEPIPTAPGSTILPNLRFVYFLGASRYPKLIGQICGRIRDLIEIRSTAWDQPCKFKIQLNDEAWDDANVPKQYLTLAADYPDNVTLSHDEETVPSRFRPIMFVAPFLDSYACCG